ncbi:hypothetical protein [Idiomarina aminovorans]|uniref:hypothetical protein n=1 Tax=Idiomarina aminovorans TaxID=2914829 RepID=UPI0020036EEA|nr:hypothetical protein [Idiomarina sp. ATCH4]MCK7460228.1 hypothetical protein [Idiomarina sp. ATCH4]
MNNVAITTIKNTIQPLLVDANEHMRFTGRYYLCEVEYVNTSEAQERCKLTLSDSSGTLEVYARYEQLRDEAILVDAMVHVEVAKSLLGEQSVRVCKLLACADDCDAIGTSLASLPIAKCPRTDIFKALLVMESRIQSGVMKEFLCDVLLQKNVAAAYLECPATLNGHHSYGAGLLEYSIDVAWNILGVQTFKPIERDTAIVAALLHDIGKTQTLTNQQLPTRLGCRVDSSHLTLELCATALKKLDAKAPLMAERLREAWVALIPDTASPADKKTLLIDVLERSKHFSIEGEQSMAFLADAEMGVPITANH